MEKQEPTVHYETIPGPLGQNRYFRTTRLGIKDVEGNPCMLAMSLDMTEDHERQLNSEATEEAHGGMGVHVGKRGESRFVAPVNKNSICRHLEVAPDAGNAVILYQDIGNLLV